MSSEALASTTMGVAKRRLDEDGPHAEHVCKHDPANSRVEDYPEAAGPRSSGGEPVRYVSIGEGKGRTPPPMSPIAEDTCNGDGREYLPPMMTPIAEEHQGQLHALGHPDRTGHDRHASLDAPPQGSMVFESMKSEPVGTAGTVVSPQPWQPWQGASTQLLKSLVGGLTSMDDVYGSATPTGAADDELQQQAAYDNTVSPPLRPIRDFHAPRTDLTKEEFTLAAVGITISMTDGDHAKIISTVQGGASVAGVCECDELVSINGVDVSTADVNGFDCVELCQQAVRAGGRSSVALGVRDFCSMQLKHMDVEVSGGCPAIRLLRERNSPRPRPTMAPGPSPRMHAGNRHAAASVFTHANFDDRPYGSRPSSLQSEEWEDDVLLHCAPRTGTLMPRTHSREHLMSDSSGLDGDSEGAGWTWAVPSILFLKLVGMLIIVGLGGALYVQHVGKEELLARLISTIDWLESVLQTLPLCPCTYWIRGSIDRDIQPILVSSRRLRGDADLARSRYSPPQRLPQIRRPCIEQRPRTGGEDRRHTRRTAGLLRE